MKGNAFADIPDSGALNQVAKKIDGNMIFKSARYCTSLVERLLDKFSRVGLPDNIATACLINAASKNLQTVNELLVNEAMTEFKLI